MGLPRDELPDAPEPSVRAAQLVDAALRSLGTAHHGPGARPEGNVVHVTVGRNVRAAVRVCFDEVVREGADTRRLRPPCDRIPPQVVGAASLAT